MQKESNDFFLPPPEQGKKEFESWLENYTTLKAMKDTPLEELIGKWKSLKKTQKELEVELDSLKQALTLRHQEQSLEPYGLLVERVKRKGSINWKSIPEIQGLDLEKYRDDEIEYWKISEVE